LFDFGADGVADLGVRSTGGAGGFCVTVRTHTGPDEAWNKE
jgi:hypothetical protein